MISSNIKIQKGVELSSELWAYKLPYGPHIQTRKGQEAS